MPQAAQRIVQEARELFMHYGLKSVSMDDIASKLGMSKKTIYQHFSDKDSLVEEVVKGIIVNNQNTCDADRNRSENAIHEIFMAVEMMTQLFHSMNPSILYDMQKYYPSSYKKFQTHKNEYLYTIIKENLKKGIGEELYRSDLDIDVISRFRVESIVMPFNPEFHNKVKKNLVEIAEEIAIHFLFGIVSQKGYQLTLKYIKDKSTNQSADDKK